LKNTANPKEIQKRTFAVTCGKMTSLDKGREIKWTTKGGGKHFFKSKQKGRCDKREKNPRGKRGYKRFLEKVKKASMWCRGVRKEGKIGRRVSRKKNEMSGVSRVQREKGTGKGT